MTEKDELIYELGKRSKTKNHELLLDFLHEYSLYGLCEASVEQLREFMDKGGLNEDR